MVCQSEFGIAARYQTLVDGRLLKLLDASKARARPHAVDYGLVGVGIDARPDLSLQPPRGANERLRIVRLRNVEAISLGAAFERIKPVLVVTDAGLSPARRRRGRGGYRDRCH